MSKEATVVEAQKTVTMGADDFVKALQSAMLSVIEIARTPVLTDAQKREIEDRQQERKENAEKERQRQKHVKAVRRACTHHRRDGSCRAVYVKGCGDGPLPDGTGSGNFFICQACQAIIRPGVEPENYGGLDIFDDALFTRLWQEAGQSEIIY